MDGLDWSKFQQQELEENLMIMPSSSNTLFHRDNYIPVQQVDKIVNSTPNVFPQWRSRSGGGASGGNWEASINASAPLNSPFHFTNPNHGPIPDPGPTSSQPTNLTGSFESIDCLLSASNQTDTTASVEDDGISLIFSNRNTSLWNNNNNNNSINANTHFKASAGSLSENTNPPNDGTNRGTQIEKNPTINNQGTKRKRADDQPKHHRFFQPVPQKPKKPVPEKKPTNINFQHASSSAEASSAEEPDVEAIAHMKEIIYQAAAFRPVDFGEEETERRPKRKNVRISSDPQTVAARERRERISERIRVLQRLVPGGSKMDTASMLDEAANYLKFLRSQVKALEAMGGQRMIDPTVSIGLPAGNYANLAFAYSPYLNYPLGVMSMPMQQMQQPQFSIQGPNPVRKPESC